MKTRFSDGMWPVMLTPFARDGTVDGNALDELTEWYIQEGSDGLFACCQSSEIFYLSLDERVQIVQRVKDKAKGRIPVIASGHIGNSIQEQIYELQAMAEAGADAVILITNRLARREDSDSVFLKNLETIMEYVPERIPLGFYECPYPYKRLLSPEVTEYCVKSGRFAFLKDTSCDIKNIQEKLNIIRGSEMKLFNANTTTLLESLKAGA